MRKYALLLFLAVLAPAAGRPGSLSDIATEQLQRGIQTVGARNPFTPAEVEGEMDIKNLALEGVLIGHNFELALLSGQIVKEGDSVGNHVVSKIAPGMMTLKLNGEEQTVKMDGYVPPLRKKTAKNYAIDFRVADLRDVLKMLAKAAGQNILTPEDFQGRVNLSFEDITILDAIRSILKVNNYSYAIENGIMRVGKPDDFKGGTDLLATTLQLKYAKSKDLVDKVKLLLSDKGSVSAEERLNILSVKDYEANIDSVRRFVDDVDQKDRQVQIEAHIVDATNDFSRSLGVQWGVSGTPDRLTISGGDASGAFKIASNLATPAHVNLGAASPTSAMGFRIGRLPGNTSIDVQLSAAESKGDIHIISRPSVTTINNAPAQIRSGVTIYVKSNSDINVGTSASTSTASSSNVQAIETGIQLDVTPQITPNEYIKLSIEATESEADFSRTVDGIPAIIDNKATTTVVLKDGETAVIGGLIKRKDTQTRKNVPGFSKIPVAGIFFKHRSKTKTYNELMVFITPRIVK